MLWIEKQQSKEEIAAVGHVRNCTPQAAQLR
jgi:hypothetical protein